MLSKRVVIDNQAGKFIISQWVWFHVATVSLQTAIAGADPDF